MKKIVIIPTFAVSHLLEHWIQNSIDVINPDEIIINEGIFKFGPENKKEISQKFRDNWCYQESSAGFDYHETLKICDKFGNLISIKCKNYKENDANVSFLDAISDFHAVDFEIGTIIFPLEPDAFLYEGDIDVINEEISKLKPGEGLSCRWVDFLETQFYTEAINLIQPKYRRFCYCFDNTENYKKAMSGFTSQNYPLLKKTESFFIRHYCWFQPEPWKQLRYELIYRSDPNYWKDFDGGLDEVRFNSELEISQRTWSNRESYPKDKIVVRPSRSDEGRYAKFIDIDHPKAIEEHPNFVK